jgi:hypothetical protein
MTMLKTTLPGASIPVIVLAGFFLAPAISTAQDRTTNPRIPSTTPARGAPRPAAPPSVSPSAPGDAMAKPVGVDAALAPNLKIAMSPLSPNTAPHQFTVTNVGGPSMPSKLGVSTTLLPTPPSSSACSGDSVACSLGTQLLQGIQHTKLVEICGTPLESFVAEIPALDPGQSHTVTRSSPSLPILIANLGTPQSKHSYYKQLTLVCVFEIRAAADATNAVPESIEQDNEFFHYLEREIQIK